MNAGQLTKASLSEEYNTSSNEAQDLLEFLNIADVEEILEKEKSDNSSLTDAQREKIEFADKLKAMGIDESDFEELIRIKRQREARSQSSDQRGESSQTDSAQNGTNDSDIDNLLDNLGLPADETSTDTAKQRRKLNKATAEVVKDIARRTKEMPSAASPEEAESKTEEKLDQDEYTPVPVDYGKRIERAKQKSAAEIDRITHIEALQSTALNSEKYSFAWFKALLELESIHSSEISSNSKEISIRFAKVKREPGTERTLVLMHPNRYIPQFMEDLADIPLVLHMEDQSKTVAIEVASVRSYTLRVKLKTGADIDGIDLESVKEATIDAKSPAFLLEELRKQFADLDFTDQFNMQTNLCENIEFVFGPPGTGKTTHLAKNILLPLMKQGHKCRVLVLTPTNQSADVLVRRIMEVSGPDRSFEDWLIRFGGTGDEEIERSPVFKDKTFDIRTLSQNVTITTIARFPYDFFTPPGTRLFLRELKWDYIVIDEASMIPLANIVYPLYKKTPEKFIVAGDPFQIGPITSVDLWKNENIYTMVHLNSFVDPQTIPYPYHVELLMTQYRSIPAIGSIFSNLVYGGTLKHHRAANSQKPLHTGGALALKTLNIIKFPVSRYESIYRAKRLRYSSYQIYSALFTFEYVCSLSKAIAAHNPDGLFKIGIIAPYRAQADIIDKLLASENLPKEVEVQVGTIHGFQGDECDIILAVFNPPPSISASNDMFLNKRNIINVAISRARDYLVLVMPDDDTANIENLKLVKRVEQLVKDTDAWKESMSSDLEKLLFGDASYLENNAFSTSHQNVNVYGLPEKCYEIRTEDNAVDVQIKKGPVHPGAGPSVKQSVLHRTPVVETGIGLDEEQSKENPVPKQLRKVTVEVQVTGAQGGTYFLVPYKGKLNNFTREQVINMFIPQVRAGKEKLVSVSVAESSRIIYIEQETFKAYKKGLTGPAGFELRR